MDKIYFFKTVDTAKRICGGVVYKSNYRDAQGDYATPDEVEKASRNFMLSAQRIKIEHRGRVRNIPVIESYFSEDRHKKGNGHLDRGDWFMSVYLGNSENRDVWEAVKSGKLRGFSMSGVANKG